MVISAILFLGGAIVTIPNSHPTSQAAVSAALMIYTLVIWLSLPTILFSNWAHIKWAFKALAITCAITSVYAIGQRLLGFPTFGPHHYWGRAIGLTRQPNEIGALCAMAFPYVMALILTARTQQAKLSWLFVSLLTLIGVLLSGSMTGAFALVGGILSYYCLTSRRGRVYTAVLVLCGVSAIAFFSVTYSSKHTQLVVQRLERLVSSKKGALTLNERLVVDRRAWHRIQSNPLVGNGYHARLRTIGGDEIQVHNTLLRAQYDGGVFTLLGVLSLLTGAAIGLLLAWKGLVHRQDIVNKPYVAASIGAFISFLIVTQASPVLYQRSAWFPIAIAFAVISVSSGWSRRRKV